MIKMLDIDYLKDLSDDYDPPRVHGNGFIQLDIGENHRLNFWGHPDIPHQNVNTEIHDHTFSFVSKILKGELHNFNYETHPINHFNTQYKIYNPQVRDGEDTILVDSGERVSTRISGCDFVSATQEKFSSYHMLGGKFHKTIAYQTAISLMKYVKPLRLLEDVPPARVLVNVEEEPDNVFNRNDHNVNVLWNIIEEIIDA